jgi:hypothetical protein
MTGEETMTGDRTKALEEEVKRLRALLKELTPPIEALLGLRGFRIFAKEPPEDLLIPSKRHLDGYYGMMKRYSFRLFLRDVIKHQDHFTLKDVARYATEDVTEEYAGFLLEARLIESHDGGYRVHKRPIKSFGATLEWFAAETLRREFSAEAIWGIKFKRHRPGGDYDLIAKIEGSKLLYMEVKSSPPKQIYQKEISAFLDRTEELSPDLAVFFMDTELRMKDKIVPMFEEELRKRGMPVPERLYKEIFNMGERIFIINSKDSVAANIGRVLSFYLRRKG